MEKELKEFADALAGAIGGRAAKYSDTYFIFQKGFLSKKVAVKIVPKENHVFVFFDVSLNDAVKQTIQAYKQNLNIKVI